MARVKKNSDNKNPGRAEHIPTTISEAILSVVWPKVRPHLHRSRVGLLLLVVAVLLVGAVKSLPTEDVTYLRSTITSAIMRFLYPPPALIVVVPRNLSSLPTSLGDLKSQVSQKFADRGSFRIVDPDDKSISSAEAVLRFSITLGEAGLDASTQLRTSDKGIVGESSAHVPTNLIKTAGPFLVEALLYELSVNWNTLDSIPSPHRANPTALALFFAAQKQRASSPSVAEQLTEQAVSLDKTFAMGFWYLGVLREAQGKTDEADALFNEADSIDPEHPRIDSLADPVEGVERALRSAAWESKSKGLRLLVAKQSDYGVDVYAWDIDPKYYKLEILVQNVQTGESAASFRKRSNAVLAVNAGRFKLDATNKTMSPAGLLILDHAKVSIAWPGLRGGVLAILNENIKIIPASAKGFDGLNASYAVQATPVMINPGGQWAMKVNDYDRQHRTAVCLLRNKHVIVIIVGNSGLSLLELAALMRPGNAGEKFNCDSAIALDGGPSTQASYLGPPALEIAGKWMAHDALVVSPRGLAAPE